MSGQSGPSRAVFSLLSPVFFSITQPLQTSQWQFIGLARRRHTCYAVMNNNVLHLLQKLMLLMIVVFLSVMASVDFAVCWLFLLLICLSSDPCSVHCMLDGGTTVTVLWRQNESVLAV